MDDVRVVELSSWMAAPSAGAVFADMGADVVKVEPLTGDVVRGRCRASPSWPRARSTSTTRSRSTTGASGRSPSPSTGRRAPSWCAASSTAPTSCCATCCRTARPATGSTPATLLARRPQLVHATLSGLRARPGPEATRPGFDVTTFFGRGAITDSMTEPGGIAPQPRPAQGDHTTGLAMVAAVLAALRMVERTGRGPGRRRQPDGRRRRGRWPPTWRPTLDRRTLAEQARPPPPHRPAGQPLPLCRRPLDRAQHDRGPLVGAVLHDDRPPRPARGPRATRPSAAASTTCPS